MKPTKPSKAHRKRGFALIITISMMILLVVLAVGLLSLSSISLRGSSNGRAMAEARTNARMALMIAIGDLQKSLGPDRRVSAPASLVMGNPNEPNLIGAWESWHWDPEEGGSPNYSEKKEGFSRWLVSGNSDAITDENFPSSGPENAIPLVSPESTASSSSSGPGLQASLVRITEGNEVPGSFAYAVMDESLKASINLPQLESRNTGEEIAARTAPDRTHPELLVSSLDPATVGAPHRLLSLSTAVVAAGKQNASEIFDRQHELTTSSLSLLTDVVDGGFKKDLTTGFESRAKLEQVFGTDTLYFTEDDGAPMWDYVRDHYQHYQDVANAGDGAPRIELGRRELRAGRRGTDTAPDSERLMPVIAKLQIVFSIVSHHAHIADRIKFFNDKGDPKGNQNYACPHLAYDPVVTLYNPYDVALELDKLRIRIWDPPVLFGFKKNGEWLRPEYGSGDFHGLARFQINNEKNAGARKFFTLLLREMRGSKPGAPIILNPGEVKVFSPWVEEDWDWALETKGGYNVRAFFDFDADNDFGNRDGRTSNVFGLESVPGWDARAGLQTDHISYANDRPASTRYAFERTDDNGNQGWLGIKLADTFSVTSKPGRTVTGSREPDFEVDLLAGLNADTERDYLRSYSFRFEDVAEDLSAGSTTSTIERTFRIGDLLQSPEDPSPGGKTPFSILTMTAKTTVDPKDVSMPWLHNHPVTEGTEQNSAEVGNALDTYDLRFEEMQDFNTFPGVEFEPNTNRGFYGASATANRGVSNVPMFRVPLVPASSLGDLIPANLVASSLLPRVTHPLGNSRAHPLIPASSVVRDSPQSTGGRMLDHSYLINECLWDDTFFSTVASFNGGLVSSTSRGAVLEEFLSGNERLLNSRLTPLLTTDANPKQKAAELDKLGDEELMTRLAGSMAIRGGFNVNSDSVDAWRVILSSLRDEAVRGWNMKEHPSEDKTSFPRSSLPLGGDAEDASTASLDIQGQIRWAGFRSLDDEKITKLAEAIVEQLRERGVADKAPSLSLAEFVNRRIGQAGGLHVLAGLLETAIEESGINDEFHQLDSRRITGNEQLSASALAGLAEPEARLGMTGAGAPSILTQGDLLMPLASVITVRGDTFRIRAYGESLNPDGSAAARAWCEAVVQRLPEYVDPSDEPELAEADLNDVNKRFGRRFVITGFRWLSPEEI